VIILEITKDDFKKALDEKRVIITGALLTRNGWTGYNVYIINQPGGNFPFTMLSGMSPYWSEKKRFYHIVAWGTNRTLEIILSIGENLGLSFGEIKQSGYHRL
jgi:hypothetical protein